MFGFYEPKCDTENIFIMAFMENYHSLIVKREKLKHLDFGSFPGGVLFSLSTHPDGCIWYLIFTAMH